ncbi:uncharacterized protein LODBEIA_P21630 [Lodderomyces beijingensis]|uniref:DUF292-domain-containing protein n=1 Tax=Lodderomyces beijingensis TaxID=1775926 RepID=A0ABP0ZJ78_9ASCO
MALSKVQHTQSKKLATSKIARRQLADLLRANREQSARIRVENIIRDDIYVELLEYIELYTELILARLPQILTTATCDSSLYESVQSIIYTANYSQLRELVQVRDILAYKYGAEFTKEAMDNSGGHVPEKIYRRCDSSPPSSDLVDLYLCEIARAYGVPYSGLNDEDDGDDGEGGGGIGEVEKDADVKVKEKEKPIAEVADTGVKKNDKSEPPAKKVEDDFDALKARFAALKGTPK